MSEPSSSASISREIGRAMDTTASSHKETKEERKARKERERDAERRALRMLSEMRGGPGNPTGSNDEDMDEDKPQSEGKHEPARIQIRTMVKEIHAKANITKMTDTSVAQAMNISVLWCRERLPFQPRSRSKGQGPETLKFQGVEINMKELSDSWYAKPTFIKVSDGSGSMKKDWLLLCDVISKRALLNERAMLVMGYPASVKDLDTARTYPRGSLWQKNSLKDAIGIQRTQPGKPIVFGPVTRMPFIQSHASFMEEDEGEFNVRTYSDPNTEGLRWILASYGVGGSAAAVFQRVVAGPLVKDDKSYIMQAKGTPTDGGGRTRIPFIVDNWGITGRSIGDSKIAGNTIRYVKRDGGTETITFNDAELSNNFTDIKDNKLPA